MRIRATWTLIKEYDIDPEYYPPNATEEQIINIDKEGFESDPDMFFSDCSNSKIHFEIIGTTGTKEQGVMKPLFIPLKTEYYEAFRSGKKSVEYRAYGKRWNERTCVLGRPVTLSKGYGKKNRIQGVIDHFSKIGGSSLYGSAKKAMGAIYGETEILFMDIACIGITITTDTPTKEQ